MNKMLLRKENEFTRVLRTDTTRLLVIDCVHKTMPKWVTQEHLKGFKECAEQELREYLAVNFDDKEDMSEKSKRIMNERYVMLQGVLAFVGNSNLRNQAIGVIEAEYGISKQTIKHYLCEYLAFNDIRALAPKERVEKSLSADEKNMRWALNKFYYTINKNTLKNAYTMMLKEKYCDSNGKLLEDYPTYYQFRYFFRKTNAYNTDLKNRLSAFASQHPKECKLIDDDEQGCKTFEVKKGRFGFKLTPPYTEERRKAASELAKNYTKNLRRNGNENPVV